MGRGNSLKQSIYFLAGAAACIALVSTVAARPFRKGTFMLRGGQAPGSGSVVQKRVLNVVFFRVEDKNGKAVKGLTNGQFRVLEDGRPKDVTVFEEIGEPKQMTIGFLMDWSGSRIDHLPRVEIAYGASFLNSIIGENHCAFAARFSDEVTPLGDYSCNPVEVTSDIRSAASTKLYGRTSLNDAIVWASTELSLHKGYRVIVIVTDGADNASRYSEEKAIRAADAAGASVFVICNCDPVQMVAPGEERMPIESVQQTARQTGGEAILVQKVADVDFAFARIADSLHNLYMIGYVPTPDAKPDSFHKLKIETMQKGLHVIAPELLYIPKPADSNPFAPPR